MNCSIEGNKYENIVCNVVKQCITPENTILLHSEVLGGSSSRYDIICKWNEEIIPMEIKKKNAPDWTQCSLKYIDGLWKSSPKSKIPKNAREIFDALIPQDLYGNVLPPFVERKITHEEWLLIKTPFKDVYVDVPSDTIRNLYKSKGCYYIQISEYGLYHLGEDICDFGVPIFDCEQRIRIRTKIHRKKNKQGYCDLSIMAACQPKKINDIEISNYSLDDIERIPINLHLL